MALPEIIKDIEARIIRPTSTDNAIVRFDGATGQVQNSTPLIDDNGKITAPRMIHSNSVSTSTDLSRIPSETEIAFETSSGNGADSVWLWREKWASANYGVFHDNNADVIHVVGNGTSRFQIRLSNGNTGVHGSLTVDGDAQIEGTVTSPKFIGDLEGKANLLMIHNTITNNTTRTTAASAWNGAVSGMSYVWGQRWGDSAIGSDTGDWQLGLRPGIYTSGGTELCMMIDGDYYSMGNKVLHAGNYNNYAPSKTGSGASGTWGISISGNAATATKLSSARTISLTGDVTGSGTFDGSANLSITTTVVDNSHNHTNYLPIPKEGLQLGSASDYERIVIALCTTTPTNTAGSSYCSGSLMYHRDNGLVPAYQAFVTFNSSYGLNYGCNVQLLTTLENTSTAALNGQGYRPCTFTYNGVHYAGVEFYFVQAATHYWCGFGNFTPFMIKYYNANTSTVLNSEINNSLVYTNFQRQPHYLKASTVEANAVYGAVWNDYAEYRKLKGSQDIPYGRVVIENGDDSLSLSTHRLQKGGNIVSDTFGFAIGETDESKLPVAVSGRVLAYPNENRYAYGPGDAVCTGPNGTVSVMTEEEIRNYPDRIIGYVSAVPDYEIWGTGNVKVDGRIWIKVK